MTTHPADLQPDRFLPEALEDRLLRLFARVAGIVMIVGLAAAWLSLVSWTSSDPSLTHATSEPVRNLAGYPGAVVSDLLLQTFGVAAIVVLTAPTFWALEMIVSGRVEASRSKATYFPFAVLVLAGAASALPMAASWPLHHGFGGILGDWIFRLVSNLTALAVPGNPGAVSGVILFAAGFASLMVSIGLALRDVAEGFGQGVRRGARDLKAAAGRIEPVLDAARGTSGPRLAGAVSAWGQTFSRRKSGAGLETPPQMPCASGPEGAFDEPPGHATRPEATRPMEPDRHSGPFYGSGVARTPVSPVDLTDMAPTRARQAAPPPLHPAGFTRSAPRMERARGERWDASERADRPSPSVPYQGGFGEAAPTMPQAGRMPAREEVPVDDRWAPYVPPAAAHHPHPQHPREAGPVPPAPPGFVGQTGALPRILRHAVPHASASAHSGLDHDGGERHGSFDSHTEAMSRAMAQRFAPRGATETTRVAAPYRSEDVSRTEADATPRELLRRAPVATDIHDKSAPQTSHDKAKTPALLKGMKFGGSGGYRRPSLDLLKKGAPRGSAGQLSEAALKANGRLLEEILKDFGIKGEVKGIEPGPVVTLYAFEPARGVKTSRVIGLADDIARSMSALSARVGVIPGRNLIGIELPNQHRQTVLLRELLESEAYRSAEGQLPIVLGKGISGEPVVADLARMPHLLVAGTTGSGKSVGVNAMILSLLYRLGPDQCRLLMIDPKMLELSVYNDIPHLLAPVVTDPHQAVGALNWVVGEMEERYKKMAQLSVRNVDVFNNRVRHAKKRGEILSRTVQTGYDARTGEAIIEREPLEMETLPYIVVVIDEFADLMLIAGKEVEAAVQRLAQMARAAGIHLVMATQRPSVDVVTGVIKANFPTRLSFKVTSRIDSRTILNETGAEQLLGRGDMLYAAGGGSARRLHGPFVADEEVEAIADALRATGRPQYVDIPFDAPGDDEDDAKPSRGGKSMAELYDEAVDLVVRERRASTSYIQRRLGIGYNRAAEIIDRMEDEGVVSGQDRRGKRKVLDGRDESEPLTGDLPRAANDDEEAA